jgi:hypothetical protein
MPALRRRIREIIDIFLSFDDGRGDRAMRRAAVRFGAKSGGLPRDGGELPAAVAAYADKVARCAYQITDEDMQRVRDAGWDEDSLAFDMPTEKQFENAGKRLFKKGYAGGSIAG